MSGFSELRGGEPAQERAAGLGVPGYAALDPLDPADLAPLLRGEARACDGAALVIFRRLGFADAAVLAALASARALARAASHPAGA